MVVQMVMVDVAIFVYLQVVVEKPVCVRPECHYRQTGLAAATVSGTKHILEINNFIY